MNKHQLAQRRQRYLDLINQGMNYTQAAHAVGVSKRTGKVWRNGRTHATGRHESPSIDHYRDHMPQPTPLHARYLSEEERIHIADLRLAGHSIRHIAATLGRAPSTISRELTRNTTPLEKHYRPYAADQRATARQQRPKTPKILANPTLLAVIQEKLTTHWSPQHISAWLARTYPDNRTMYACLGLPTKEPTYPNTPRNTSTEVPRVLFLGICLDFYFLVMWVVSPKLCFHLCRRTVPETLVKP